MKIPVSDETLLLCERLLARYETLCIERQLGEIPPEFMAWVCNAHAEVRAARHKAMADVVELAQRFNAQALEGRAL